jgi:hypothetical protein
MIVLLLEKTTKQDYLRKNVARESLRVHYTFRKEVHLLDAHKVTNSRDKTRDHVTLYGRNICQVGLSMTLH